MHTYGLIPMNFSCNISIISHIITIIPLLDVFPDDGDVIMKMIAVITVMKMDVSLETVQKVNSGIHFCYVWFIIIC